MHRHNLPILFILAFSLLVRLLFISRYPFGFNQDEASQGYSAYSLLKTGMDEWGSHWPVTSMKSFLDYKAPLYTYLTIPSIAIFGLNEFAVRLPSAIFGVATIYGIYLLFSVLFPHQKTLSFIPAFLLSISPWSIQFSRSAMEANLFPTLFIFGLYFFLRHRPKDHFITAILWGLSFYSYHAAKIFLPPFIAGLYLWQKPKINPISPIIFLVLSLPVFIANIVGPEGARGKELSVSNLHPTEIISISKTQYYSPLNHISTSLSRLVNNKYLEITKKFTSNYLGYYSPTYWFSNGSGDQSYANIPNRSLIYLWLFPLFLYGLFRLSHFQPDQTTVTLLLWGLLAALPAAITKDGSHPNRAVTFMGILEIVSAYGLISFIQMFAPQTKKILIGTIISISTISFIFFANDYLFRYPINYPQAMSHPWQQAVQAVIPLSESYSQVRLEPRYELQAYLAFYLPIDPELFQSSSQQWLSQTKSTPVLYLDQLPEITLAKYTIKDFSWPDDANPDTLYLASAERDLPKNRRTISTIKTISQEPVVEIFDFRNDKK